MERKWAEIHGKIIRHVFSVWNGKEPVFCGDIQAVDITDFDPLPEPGDVFDFEKKTFSKPLPPEPTKEEEDALCLEMMREFLVSKFNKDPMFPVKLKELHEKRKAS